MTGNGQGPRDGPAPGRGPLPNQGAPAARTKLDNSLYDARRLFADGLGHEEAGRYARAGELLRRAADLAAVAHAPELEAEAASRLAVIYHHEGRPQDASTAAHRSIALARLVRSPVLEAQCLNVMAGIELERGSLDSARRLFADARQLADDREELVAKIEENLGIVANVEGDLSLAESHYLRALEVYRRSGDRHGIAMTLHNLGMIAADHRDFGRAEDLFTQVLGLARATGVRRLEGLCHLNRAEVLAETQRYSEALEDARVSLAIFVELGSVIEQADCYRVIGATLRALGNHSLAESHLTVALREARRSQSTIAEAEASRELARLRLEQGETDEALQYFREAAELFGRIGARTDLQDVETRIASLG